MGEQSITTAITTSSPKPTRDQAVEARRLAMPIVSAFIDLCREAYGAEFVDQQMATAQQARREHAAVLATQGAAAARLWHQSNAHRCTFFAAEGGRTVGLPSPWGSVQQKPEA